MTEDEATLRQRIKDAEAALFRLDDRYESEYWRRWGVIAEQKTIKQLQMELGIIAAAIRPEI